MNYSNRIQIILFSSIFGLTLAAHSKECAWKTKSKHTRRPASAAQESIQDALSQQVVESDRNPRWQVLSVRKKSGTITPKETVELETLQTTNSERAAKLAVKEFSGAISEVEKAELDVLKATGNPRQAFLVAKQKGGETLSEEETIEYQALTESAGNGRYSYLSILKFKGETMSTCDQQELTHLQETVRKPASIDTKDSNSK